MKSRCVAMRKVESPSAGKSRDPGMGCIMPLAKRRGLRPCTSLAQLGNGKERAAGHRLRWQRGEQPRSDVQRRVERQDPRSNDQAVLNEDRMKGRGSAALLVLSQQMCSLRGFSHSESVFGL